MRPSRKPTVKVMVTISQENMPQWYESLKNIDSGHVRAAVLRAHLKNPGEAAVFQQLRNGTSAPTKEPITTTTSNPETQARPEAQTPPATPAGTISTVPTTARGGLASAMLRAGQDPKW